MLTRRSLVLGALLALVSGGMLLLAIVLDWGALATVLLVAATVAGLAWFSVAAAGAARQIVRLLRSIHNYARLSSERTAAMQPSLSSLSGSVRTSARRARARAEGGSPRAEPAEKASSTGVLDRSHERAPVDDGATLVLVLGPSADSAELRRFVTAAAHGDVVVVTDRADLVSNLARTVPTEYLPLDAIGIGGAIARVVALAAEGGASRLVVWPDDGVALPLPADAAASLAEVDGTALRALLAGVAAGGPAARSTSGELHRSLEALRKSVDLIDQRAEKRTGRAARELRTSIDELYWQLEALATLYRWIDGRDGLPRMRGWAVSPDLAVQLLDRVAIGGVRTIVELGSGTSTVLFAIALERVGEGHVTTIEHDPGYAERTRRLLQRYGVAHRATVLVTPLVEQQVDGETFRWYQLDGVRVPDGIDLLFVDGPPEATGPRSRYPALPLLHDHLADEAEIVLDDGRRPDETEIAELWSRRDDVVHVEPLPHERKPILLRYRRPA